MGFALKNIPKKASVASVRLAIELVGNLLKAIDSPLYMRRTRVKCVRENTQD